MPKCCGVESERIDYPSGGYTYYCQVCKKEWLPAEGLEFLNKPKVTITLIKPKKNTKKKKE